MEDVHCVIFRPGVVMPGDIISGKVVDILYEDTDKKGNKVMKEDLYPILNTTLMP